MPLEIEKKYLVLPQQIDQHIQLDQYPHKLMVQGYLASSDLAVIRIRVFQDRGRLTIKQRRAGIKRIEVERDLSIEEANELLSLCGTKKVEKQRYFVPHGKYTIELDIFLRENAGLIIAEVEFQDEEEANAFDPPEWFSTEVSGDLRYYNHYLSECPYISWKVT
ncbi:MAG: CYTH domain-containing protein [Flavobacteriaceae bacterium]